MSSKWIPAVLVLSAVTPLFAGGVVVFEEPGYTGASELIEDDVANMNYTELGNDRVSAIRVPRGYRAILFEHRNFKGKSVVLDRSEPNLDYTRLGNNRLSSVRVVRLDDYWPDLPGDISAGITLFSEPDYQGDYEIVTDTVYNLSESHIGNDRTASVFVPPGFSVTLFEHKNCSGKSLILDGPEPDLDLTPMGTNRVSSLIVHRPEPPIEPPVTAHVGDALFRVGIHLEDDDIGDALAVAGGILLVSAAIKAARQRNRVPGPGITLYDGAFYRGSGESLNRSIRKMKKTKTGNDRVSSIRVPPGYEVTLYEDDGFRGRSLTIRESVADLGSTSLGDNRISSFRIRWLGQ